MPAMRRLLPLLALASAAACGHAASDSSLDFIDPYEPFAQMRLGFGFTPIPTEYPTTAEFTPVAGGGSLDFTDHYDSEVATSLRYGIVGGWLDPFGAVFGAELVYSHASRNLTGREVGGTMLAPAPGAKQP
jgi:hypothetical protein